MHRFSAEESSAPLPTLIQYRAPATSIQNTPKTNFTSSIAPILKFKLNHPFLITHFLPIPCTPVNLYHLPFLVRRLARFSDFAAILLHHPTSLHGHFPANSLQNFKNHPNSTPHTKKPKTPNK